MNTKKALQTISSWIRLSPSSMAEGVDCGNAVRRMHRTIQFSMSWKQKSLNVVLEKAGPGKNRARPPARRKPAKVGLDGAVAQLARAPALHAGGQGFNSLQLHHLPHDMG